MNSVCTCDHTDERSGDVFRSTGERVIRLSTISLAGFGLSTNQLVNNGRAGQMFQQTAYETYGGGPPTNIMCVSLMDRCADLSICLHDCLERSTREISRP
jgi:hypothetical protein